MNKLFADLLDIYIIVYLDFIPKTWKNTRNRLKRFWDVWKPMDYMCSVRGHLYLHPWTPWQHSGAILACLLVTSKHTSLAPILLALTPKDVYNIEYPFRSLILISKDSPGGELYHSH